MSFDAFDFRQTMSRFATGVTVVILKDDDGQLHGVTINSLTSVSLDPPLILFCLKTSSQRCNLLREVGTFSLNILSEHQQSVAHYFARRDLQDIPTPEFVYTTSPVPSLKGCVAHLYGQVEAIYPGGDHTIFLSRVTHLSWDTLEKPLIFFKSIYTSLPEQAE